MKYEYKGRVDREMSFDRVSINGSDYQVPAVVAATLEEYKNELSKEKAAHDKTIARYEKLNSEKYEDIAWRIMLALEEAAGRESLLSHSIDYYTSVDSAGEPKLEYRHELQRRIILAIKGLTPKGEPFNN